MPQIQILEANPNKGWASVAGAFGQGLGQGIQDVSQLSLQQKMNALEDQRALRQNEALYQQELKRLAPALEYQRSLNRQSASNLADFLGIPEEKKSSFVNAMQDISGKDQSAQQRNIAEAQMYNRFNAEGPAQGGFKDSFINPQSPQELPGQMPQSTQGYGGAHLMQNVMGLAKTGQLPERTIPQVQQQKAPTTSKVKLGNYTFEPNELPPKAKLIPQIGPLKSESQFQIQTLGKNRDENIKYLKDYSDISKLRDAVKSMKEAKRLIETENVDPGKFIQAIQAIAEEKHPNLKSIFSTSGQAKLSSLLTNAIQSKNIGGSNPSTREVLLAMERLPSGLNTKETNLYIADRLIENTERNLAKAELGNQLLKYDQHMDHGTFKDLIERKVEENYPDKGERISVKDEQGNIGSIPKYQWKDAEKQGFTRL
jgi:hypothetical protein